MLELGAEIGQAKDRITRMLAGRPGEAFLHGAKVGSDSDGLHSDIGVLLSRALQHGDAPASLASGMGRLGDGTTPCSIVGVVADVLAEEAPGSAEDARRARQAP